MSQMETAAKSETNPTPNGNKKPKPAAKPKAKTNKRARPASRAKVKKKVKRQKAENPPKDLIGRAVLEKCAKNHTKVEYIGSREKFHGSLVEVLSVRDEERHGFDARVKFKDGVSMYVSPTSLKSV